MIRSQFALGLLLDISDASIDAFTTELVHILYLPTDCLILAKPAYVHWRVLHLHVLEMVSSLSTC